MTGTTSHNMFMDGITHPARRWLRPSPSEYAESVRPRRVDGAKRVDFAQLLGRVTADSAVYRGSIAVHDAHYA